MTGRSPRLVIAGSSGDSGKTTVSLGLLAAWRNRGLSPIAFKKGPDFIDAAWLGWASGNVGRNLDTFLMSEEQVRRSFCKNAIETEVALIEGNRGLLDGMDEMGTHSTAALAMLLETPVVLVLPVTKVTRSAAATVLGLKQLEPGVKLAGVILNRVAGPRHQSVCRRSIESLTGVPVLGAIPRIRESLLADRHLGLVPPEESKDLQSLFDRLSHMAEEHIDLDAVLEVARQTADPTFSFENISNSSTSNEPVSIGYIRDSAFTFYYPENLEVLESAGARLVPVSSMKDEKLPELDALYIGGGFPETHGQEIAANRTFLNSMREAADAGMPIYAECGGLMLLSEAFCWNGVHYPMAGVLNVRLAVGDRPASSHGYMRVKVDQPNPFYPVGMELMGHEFHYSRLAEGQSPGKTAFTVTRGGGCYPGRDGMIRRNVMASYLHVHALGTNAWVDGMIQAARWYKGKKDRKETSSVEEHMAPRVVHH